MKNNNRKVLIFSSAATALVFTLFIAVAFGQQKKATPNVALDEVLGNQPDTYSATQSIEQGGRNSMNLQIARKGEMYRIEVEQIGVKIVTITRPDLKKSFTLRPDKKLYSETEGTKSVAMRLDPFDLEHVRTLAP